MPGHSISIDREQLLTRVHDLDSLQPLPTNALRLIQLCQTPGACTDEIMSIIESEPAIAARILAVANSPLYGYSRQIGSISHAVVILGIRNISRLAASFAADNMYSTGDANTNFCKNLYKHSLGCALVARSLTDVDPVCDPEQAFLGGLLHDIGKLALIQLLPDDYESLQQSSPVSELLNVEYEQLGISHEEIGGICAKRWGLPIAIVDVISNHHGRSTEPVASSLSQVVEAANCVAHCEGIGGIACEIEPESFCSNPIIENLTPENRQQVVDSALAEFDVLDSAN